MTCSSSQLFKRCKYRHNTALSVFANTVKEINMKCDTDVSKCIVDLQKKLLECRTHTNNMILSEAAMIEKHRRTIRCSSEAFEADRSLHVLLVDEFHREGGDSINSRGNHARDSRTKLLEKVQQTVSLYMKRMAFIESSQDDIRNIEKNRRRKLQDSLDTLCISMSAAAFVEETELQVIVQRATHQCNQQLLLNQASLAQSISQLKQREILHQRHTLQKWASMYNILLDVIRDSFLLWTTQYLSSDVFSDPHHRKEVLRIAGERNKMIANEVHHVINGLTSLSATLLRRRSGSRLREICGGTEPSGWLRDFDDNFHNPVLSNTTDTVTEEWYTFSKVVVKNARVKMAEIIDDMQEKENIMIHRIAATEQLLVLQLTDLYTPTEEEMKIINQCCIKDGFNFPLHNISVQSDKIARCRDEVTLLLSNIMLRIQNESDYFMGMLRETCDRCVGELEQYLIDGERSAMVVVGEISRLLEKHLTASHSILRAYWAMQEESTKDYNDSKASLEDEFAAVKLKLSRAGSVEEAGKLYVTGMQMLNAIEELYHTYHRTCVGSMVEFQENIEEVLNSQQSSLFQMLHIEKVSSEDNIVNHDTQTTVIRWDETVYLVTHKDWELESPVGLRRSSTPLKDNVEEKTSPVPAAVSKKGKTKLGKAQSRKSGEDSLQQRNASESVPVTDTVSLHTTDNVAASSNPTTVSSHFIDHCREMLLQSYPLTECLLFFADLVMFKKESQINIGKWSLALGKYCVVTAQDYCKERRISINADINSLIRNHMRRPVDLQSNIYEVRIRELQVSSQSQSQQLAVLRQRVVAIKVFQKALVDDSHTLFVEDIKIIYDFVAKIPQCPSRTALATHFRSMKDMSRKVASAIDNRTQTLRNQLQDQVRSIKQDCNNFRNNGLKSHDEGGSLSLDEQRDAYANLDAVLQDLYETEEYCTKSLIGTEYDDEMARLREAEREFEVAKSRSEKEIDFLTSLTKNVSDLKGKVSSVLLFAENDEIELDKLVEILENAVTEKDSDKSHIAFSSIMENLCSETTKITPEVWGGFDELLSSKLRRLQTEVVFKLHQSRAQRILETLSNLRVPLFKNSVLIGCLKHHVTLVALPPDTYVDPAEEWSQALIAVEAPVTSIATTKKNLKTPIPIPGKVVKPPHVMFEVSNDCAVDYVTEPLPLVESLSSLNAEWATATTAKLRDIVEQYCVEVNDINCPVLRGHVMGSDKSEIQRNIELKVEQQSDRVRSYCEAAHKRLISRISRVQVALMEASEEVFKSLLRCCLDSIASRLKVTLTVFTTYYNSMCEAQRMNNERLKGSLSAPSNRGVLTALKDRETTRQTATQVIIKKMWGVCMREAQSEARRSALRFTSTIQIFFSIVKGIVSPAHVTRGVPPVGHHMGLRRLVFRKEKELPLADLQGCTNIPNSEQRPELGTRGGRTRQGTLKDGTSDKRKKEERIKEKKMKLNDESPPPDESKSPYSMLSPLVVSNVEYSSVELNVIKVFDAFVAQSAEVAKSLVNHYLLPSQWEQDATNDSAKPAGEQVNTTDAQRINKDIETNMSTRGTAASHKVSDSTIAATSCSQTGERSIKLLGPGDALHRRAYASRQACLDTLNANFNSVASEATQYFCRILLSERQWSILWKDALSKISQR